MAFFDKFRIKVVNKVLNWASTVRGYTPSFSEFGEDIMNDDTVLTIVNRILDEYSKLNPRHIRTVNGRQVKVSDNNINTLLENPNPYMTKTDFLRKIAFLRETYENVFIYPSYDLYVNNKTGQKKKVYTGLYPLQPNKVDFYEDDNGTLYIEFQLPNGEYSGKILYDEVIHWRKNFGINDYMGGNSNGLPNNTALLRHLQLNDKLLQSTFKTIEGSLTINGILKFGGLLDDEKREAARIKFENSLKKNESGIIALDSGGEYSSIPFNGKLIDKETLDLFNKKILQHYGVSEAILNGDYTNEQKEAFYETVLESGVISLGEAFSRVMLTTFERSNGNTIIFYTNKIQMMNADKKIKLAELLLPVGGLSPNEVREMFGLMAYDGGDERLMSLNYIKTKDASKYQVGENDTNSKVNDKNDANNGTIEVGENDD